MEDYHVSKNNNPMDQKAVETEEKSTKLRSQIGLGRHSELGNRIKGSDNAEKTDQSVTSFNQMRFWRNRFESDRIRTFLDSRKKGVENTQSESDQRSINKTSTPERPLQRKRMTPLNSDKNMEDTKSTQDIPFLETEALRKPHIKVTFDHLYILN